VVTILFIMATILFVASIVRNIFGSTDTAFQLNVYGFIFVILAKLEMLINV
jgi:hypothetical protein